MEHFHNCPASRFDLAYIHKQTIPCRMCWFLRDCLAIEQADGSNKPKLAFLSASEFFGMGKDKTGFKNGPCPVFAAKKQDRRGCIMPVWSAQRGGPSLGARSTLVGSTMALFWAG